MTPTKNMRRETRVDAKVPVEVHRGRAMAALETSDVSFKGLFLCTVEPPPLRSLVRLRVTLPSRTIEAHAMVVHVVDATPPHSGVIDVDGRRAGVGLQFWGLAGPERTTWDDYVRGLFETLRASKKIPPIAAFSSK